MIGILLSSFQTDTSSKPDAILPGYLLLAASHRPLRIWHSFTLGHLRGACSVSELDAGSALFQGSH
jgi:hypothetical protein